MRNPGCEVGPENHQQQYGLEARHHPCLGGCERTTQNPAHDDDRRQQSRPYVPAHATSAAPNPVCIRAPSLPALGSRSDRRGVRDRRAGHTGEHHARNDGGVTEPDAPMADNRLREFHQSLGDASGRNELAGEDEIGQGEQAEVIQHRKHLQRDAHAPVDRDQLTGNVVRRRRGEEHRKPRNLIGIAPPPGRRTFADPGVEGGIVD